MLRVGGWLVMLKNLGVLLFAVSTLSCNLLGQSKPTEATKPRRSESGISSDKSLSAPVELSKEFMTLARKAFAAIDRLDQHFLDTKTVTLNGRREILSDEKMSWTLRAVAAETAADELMAVAESPAEKRMCDRLRLSLHLLEGYHEEIEVKVEQAVQKDNFHESEMAALGVPSTSQGTVAGVYSKALEDATRRRKELFTESCFVAVKEAVIAGIPKEPEQCKARVNEAKAAPSLK
jgi:hypothetical protein